MIEILLADASFFQFPQHAANLCHIDHTFAIFFIGQDFIGFIYFFEFFSASLSPELRSG
jgi:hypothetical protein